MAAVTGDRRRAMVESTGTIAEPLMGPLTNAKATRAKWLELRATGIGASDVASILGVEGAYGSAFSVWWAKRNPAAVDNDSLTEEQEWGLRLEDAIATKFQEGHKATGDVIRPPAAIYAHPLERWMLFSPDRFVVETPDPLPLPAKLRPLELKTDQNSGRWGDMPPECYRIQLLWQCAVLGVTEGYLAALVHKTYLEYRIAFDAQEIADVVGEVRTFWHSVQSGQMPELDGHAETRRILVEHGASMVEGTDAFPDPAVIDEYEAAYNAERVAGKRRKAAENKLRQAMGSAQYVKDLAGRNVAQRLVFKNPGYTVNPYAVDQLRRSVQAK